MKKRLFSIFIAVVMIATAINFAPVLEVYATGGGKMNNQYSLYDGDGRWDAGQYYWNDGDYSGIVADYKDEDHSNGVNKQDENFKTRHVTMFNDCDAHYNSKMDSGFPGTSTPIYQVEYTNTSSWSTRRGASSDNKVKVNDYTNTTLGHTLNNEDKKKGWSAHTAGNKILPFLVYGYGCTVDFIQDHTNGGTRSNWSAWKNDTWSTFYAPSTGDGDFRMAFRNYYNTDYVTYNPAGKFQDSYAEKRGLDIRDYEYLEFDVRINSASQWKKSRSGDPANGYVVYLYSEPNCASDYYVDGEGANTCIEGYGTHWDWNFMNQLFDSNGNLIHGYDTWVTIRLPIRDAIKNATSPRTVKQITIRMIGGNKADSKAISVDDIRFVKNDDHEGVVYQGFDGYTAQDYPSGEYFMINDFEYEHDTVEDGYGGRNASDSNTSGTNFWKGTNGVVRPFKGDGTSGSVVTDPNATNYSKWYPTYQLVIRGEDANLNDKYNKGNSSYNWTHNTRFSPTAYSNTMMACEGFVTQGTYGTVLQATKDIYYHCNSGGWQIPMYYQRHYSTPMDLSKYTHFAIDINLRYAIPDNQKGAQGVTFSIQLFEQYTMTNAKMSNGEDHDDYNFLNGYTIKFFLPYGADCWRSDLNTKDTSGGFGRIIPLSTYKPATSGKTAYGGMRLIFTVEDILKGNQTYYKYIGISGYPPNPIRGVHYGAYCLDKIDGMRFVWMNRFTDTDNRYNTYGNKCNASVDGVGGLDIMLDNFIAYRPDTSITIKNETDSGDVALDANQQYVYNIYGGYTSTNNAYLNGELGSLTPNVNITGKYDGTEDYFTQNQSHRLSVPANGSVTIRNLPFNSYYVSQENWSWRYAIENVTCDKTDVLKTYTAAAGNTATVLPRVSLDGSGTRHVSILDLMKQRNFTLTFRQKRTQTLYLDSNGQAAVNNFN